MQLWMKEDEALRCGLTHHGKMFGVPCWVTDPSEQRDGLPTVVTKFAPAEVWITMCTIACQMISVFNKDAAFPIVIGQRIDRMEPQ
jgi:hypothetical protein